MKIPLSTLFDQQYVLYPYDPVFLIKTDRLYQEIEERDLSFATPEVEQLVKDYSETLYLLLMQNALRADLCGIRRPGRGRRENRTQFPGKRPDLG